MIRVRWLGACVVATLSCVMGCERDDAESPADQQESVCALPLAQLDFQRGRARTELSAPMTLPVLESLALSAGTSSEVNLTYELSAKMGGEVSCTYEKAARGQFKLKGCERELDATSWIDAKAVRVEMADSNARGSVALCPVRAVVAEVPNEVMHPHGEGVDPTQVESVPVPFTEIEGALRTEDAERFVAAARRTRQVRELLGERSAYIQYLSAAPDKPAEGETIDPHHLRLIFFSHTKNRAVEAIVRGETLESVNYIELWPSEGKEELEMAIELAVEDPRLAGRISDLEAGGMLWQPKSVVPYIGHRVMDIRFIDPSDRVARYFATVDLTDEAVLEAGPVE